MRRAVEIRESCQAWPAAIRIADGVATNTLPGRVLRGQGYQAAR
jgi:hypothetical protein